MEGDAIVISWVFLFFFYWVQIPEHSKIKQNQMYR